MEKWSIFEAPKTLVYVYNTMLLVLGISKKDITVFLTLASLLGWFLACVVIGYL